MAKNPLERLATLGAERMMRMTEKMPSDVEPLGAQKLSACGLLVCGALAAAGTNWAAWADSMEARHEGIPVLRKKMRAIAAAIAPLLKEEGE